MKHLPAALSLAAVLCLTAPAFAQTPQFTDPANLAGERVTPRDGRELPIDQGASGLAQLLRKLNTRASLMNIVAHPDDEDGGMLTLYSRGLGARVADLSLNRGEGGQNAMTADFEDALGLLRTQELLSCDRYSNVDQFFGTEVDFGFSKTKEEAFAKWTHERVLYDVVRAIRIYRPLVLTSTWIGGVTDGHGQHQVSGQIAQEAFLAAGDPKIFPELTAEGILPWQPLRIYARVPMQSISPRGLFDYATGQYTPARSTNYVTGEVSTTTPTTDILVHEGTPDPLLTAASACTENIAISTGTQRSGETCSSTDPLTYVQFARLGLSQQKSQIGPGFRTAPSGTFDVAYHLYGDLSSKGNASTPRATSDSEDGVILSEAKDLRIPSAPAPTSAHTNTQVPRGFSRGSHSPRKDVGFSPQGMPSSPDPNFFTGIDTSLLSIQDLAPDAFPTDLLYNMTRVIRTAQDRFDPLHPEKIADALSVALQIMDGLIPQVEKGRGDPIGKASALHELRIKRVQLNDALILALGLDLDATTETDTGDIVIDDPVPVKVQLKKSSAEDVVYNRQVLTNSASKGIGESVGPNTVPQLLPASGIAFENTLTLPVEYANIIQRPYFHRTSVEQAVYDLDTPELRNAPQSLPSLTLYMGLSYRGTSIRMIRIVHDSATLQPLRFITRYNTGFNMKAQVFPLDARSIGVHVFKRTETAPPYLPYLRTPAGDIHDNSNPYSFNTDYFTLPAPDTNPPAPFNISVRAGTLDGKDLGEGNAFLSIGYGELPRTNLFLPNIDHIVPVDLNLNGMEKHTIAYVTGTGDSIPDAVRSLGIFVDILKISDLTLANLSQYPAVILGVRTYAAHPDLHGAPTQALLDYARAGGNVIVQYQTPEFTAADAPFPLSLGSNEKVVDETAPVRLIDDKTSYAERLLVVPNKITSADFSGWVEERGHGFLSSWDPRYTAPTETHDPGQAPQRGGLITTRLGSGHWTYVAFALYRQLPEAVPGAFRLLANLLTP